MPIIRCPICQDKMKVAPEDLGERVVCPGCDHRFTARDDDPADEDDDRPRRGSLERDRPRRKPKSNKVLWLVLGTVGILVFLVCGGCIGFGVYMNTAKESFAGPWTDHSLVAADGGTAVRASFPAVPVSNVLADTTNGGNGTSLSFSNVEQTGSLKDAVFLIGYVDYPAGTANPLEKGYLPIRAEIADLHLFNPLVPPRIVSETGTTVSGYPGKEARYAADDGDFVLRVVHVNDRPKGSTVRLVVVLAGGTGLKEEDKQKFLNLVKIEKGR